jgi:hypothetical protein
VIGYNAFENKIIEINYDKNILVVHALMNEPGSKYRTVEMKWRGSTLFIEGDLKTKNKIYRGLFLFDTGSKFALSLTKGFSSRKPTI